jgi:heat-inducible transcriptional repressor
MEIRLSGRQQQVLGATVRYYVATARPVGSEALVEEFTPRVSPATIRNTMGFLEKAGFLYQPHTSAGRVPSDSGYRLYVDQLMMPSDVAAHQVGERLSKDLDLDGWSLEAILRGAAQILAALSGYITLITLPQSNVICLRHVQLVPFDKHRLLMVVVLDSGDTQSIVINLPPAIDHDTDSEALDRELQLLSNFLNSHLRNKALSDITTLDWGELGREFQHYSDVVQKAVSELKRLSRLTTPVQMMVSGVSEVLRRQPEFSEIQQVQTIIQLLESEQEQLWPLIFDAADVDADRRVTVRIGAENPLEPIRMCTLVSATYQRGDVSVGSVGMLGPTRMMYENAIALVSTTADYLSDALSYNS